MLNDIVNRKNIFNPAQVLELLNLNVQIALKQDQTENNDGMDICFCRIERTDDSKAKIIFSGAKRPLYYKKKDIETFKIIDGDRQSIGGIRSKRSKLFYTNKEIILNGGDLLYLTSDGFVDQHGEGRAKYGSKKLIGKLQNIK